MVDFPPAVRLEDLTPLPYQQALAAHLQANEPEVWRWAASAEAREEHAAAVRADLLRNSYRLDADAHPELHAHCNAAVQRLGITARVALYQAGDGTMNATLYFLPGEAHIVLSGPLMERLQGAELQAVLGHELAHYLLWARDGGKYHVVDRLLHASASDPRADASHQRAARRYGLYTEAFADRGACMACEALEPAVSALIKMQTGLTQVNVASYLRAGRRDLRRARTRRPAASATPKCSCAPAHFACGPSASTTPRTGSPPRSKARWPWTRSTCSASSA
jgi:predicted SprT family Zn-dependent metalloprotease